MSNSRRVAQDPTLQSASAKPGSVLAAAFQYTEPSRDSHFISRPASETIHHSGMSGLSPRRRAQQVAMSSYVASTDLPPAPPPIFVRALYNYEADDHTSLSFRQGEIIQVLTQLESGWWDGVINDVRGWFPSNYTMEITNSDDTGEAGLSAHDESETGSGTEEDYDEEEDDSDVHTQDEDSDLPIEGANTQIQEEAAFWVPQATPDGRLFYFNTLTGVSTMELPLETSTSGDEIGPRNRNNFHVPEQTRPPPEMMALGYGNEEEYDGSASEADGEQSFILSHKKGFGSMNSASISASTSMDSISGTAARQPAAQFSNPLTTTFGQASISMALPPLRATDTSFMAGLPPKLSKSPTPRFFLEDTGVALVTWNNLVENMRIAVDAYRHAIKTRARADYVRRAEDISDHLRMLLAAGSGTTDNHSGNPSIISSNKALYPHFREMMSKFSKLVLSSHIAAADWPGPDALTKCLQEAEGVMNGVYGYVEVARQQRGEEIPRLVPGFILGSTVGGSWRDNYIESQTNLDEVSFMDSNDESRYRPSEPLDASLLRRIEDSKKNLSAAIRRLEETLSLTEKVVTPARQSAIGDAVCQGAGFVLEQFRPWISQIESIDLSALGNVFQKPSLADFGFQKQKAYDAVGELIAACQAVTMPLPDEWAEVRGESLDTRINNVRGASRQLDAHVSNFGSGLELLLPAAALNSSAPTEKRDKRVTDGGETYQTHHLRADSKHGANLRPALTDLGQSKSYTMGEDAVDKLRRPPTKDKARQFFGQIPPNLSQLKTNIEPNFTSEEVPWYLQLDHSGEVTYDTKNDPPQVKSGTLTGLVEQLTRHDRPDPKFTTTFLLTYRSFTSALELFELLVRRFNLQPPAGLSRDEYSIWEEHKQNPARFRVLNIIKTWLEQYWMEADDAASQELLERMLAFAKSTHTTTKIPLAKALSAIIDQRLKGGEALSKKLVLTLTSSAPPSILPKNMKKLKFLDIDPREFARQLTIMESKLYGKIKPVECLAKTWERKAANVDPSDTALNVKALIYHSNKMTNWVSSMILAQSEVKKRVVIIKQFVQIAEQCRALNNFSSVTAIVSALGTSHIVRLGRTWQGVNPKTNAMLEGMRNLIASGKNFLKYRETLRLSTPPCIPFLGVYLTDLTFIEDGIPSHIKGSELINFAKRTKTAEVIRDIQQYQNSPYGLNPVPELQEWIAENMRNAGNSDDDMFAQSLKVEPREREEEKIARLLSESGFL